MAKKNLVFPSSVFFLGIGGIGVSAIANLALNENSRVYGTDITDSPIIKQLRSKGAVVDISSDPQTLPNVDLVVHTTAAKPNHKILLQAKRERITIKTYPEILGDISKQCLTIAVSGTHGKSTTTAMIGIMLEQCGLDPLVIVGTLVPQWKGNLRVSNQTEKKARVKKKLFVVEADEYKSAMLQLKPDIIVLTRVEEDHLDYYKNLAHIISEFKKYVLNLPKNGYLVANWNDKNIRDIASHLNFRLSKYNNNDQHIGKRIKKILKVPGNHNIENALAAYNVGKILELSEKQILTGLSCFKGSWRRLENVGNLQLTGTAKKIPVISDYAHHPTEIRASLQALKEQYPKKRLVLVYQPHQHNRTKTLFRQFVRAFDQADVLVLNEIFDVAGREEDNDQNVSSKKLLNEIKKGVNGHKNCHYGANLRESRKKMLKLIKPDDVLVIMGAGDIDVLARNLVKNKSS